MANKSNKCQRYDGYAMLMIPNNGETALHGCYYLSDKALRMRYVLVKLCAGLLHLHSSLSC